MGHRKGEKCVVKFIGVVFIISGGLLAGHYFAEKSLIRIHILEELEQALQFMYGEIEYAASAITGIFGSLAARSRYCKEFWLYMHDRLLENEGGALYSIWEDGLDKSVWSKYLLYEDRLFMGETGKNIGNLDRQSQLHTLEIFKKRLANIILAARSEYKARAKVCHAAGAAAGIFLSILLV